MRLSFLFAAMALVVVSLCQDMTANDKRPPYMRVRNSLGAQVGRVAGVPIKLKSMESAFYVMPVVPLENAGQSIRDQYSHYGMAFRTNDSKPFVTTEWIDIQIESGVYAVVEMENTRDDGKYAVVFLEEGYETKRPCIEDICLVCGGNGKTCLDCTGKPFGILKTDQCGVCGGLNMDKDCKGVCFGNATIVNGECV